MSVFIAMPKKGNVKECSKYHTFILISHAMLKILQARLQQYKLENFKIYKLCLKEAEEPQIKLSTFVGSGERKRVPEKHLFLLH